jgi:catechol 2,3-dioxygenase-like lactoylglutathione lyase family enzyme
MSPTPSPEGTMTVQLNHTIVQSHDKQESAQLLARILGLDPPGEFGHFVTVEVANGVSLDFDDAEDVRSQHYAFLVDDESFEPIFERLRAEHIAFYADPGHQRVGELNTRHGGRGFYFSGPEGHNLEVLTRASGSA